MTTPTLRRAALVTGASSGIGEAFARRLAADDYALVLVARRGDVLEKLAASLRAERGVEVDVLPADLTHEEDLSRVQERVRTDTHLELLVNNAGFGSEGAFHELDVGSETRMLRLNVEALMRLTHAALQSMVPRGHGAIINVSSGTAFAPAPYFATYAATKAFVNHFTEAVAEELRGTGVKLQALCPGFTRTEFQERAGVDTAAIPDFAWMQPEAVVDASLAELERGTLVCVPGLGNRIVSLFSGPLARPLVRRAMGAFGRRQRA